MNTAEVMIWDLACLTVLEVLSRLFTEEEVWDFRINGDGFTRGRLDLLDHTQPAYADTVGF